MPRVISIFSGLNGGAAHDSQTSYPGEQQGDSGQFLQIRQKNPNQDS
jgi:hypothetical protein